MVGPSGVLPGLGAPDQSVLSFNWNRSVTVPPKTMAPVLAFPNGNASSQAMAGCRYHNLNSGSLVWALAPKKQNNRMCTSTTRFLFNGMLILKFHRRY